MLEEIFAQESGDPFLTLITLNHPTFPDPLRFVNNSVDIVSRGNTYKAFAVEIGLPIDDGENQKEFSLIFDNVSLELIDEIRSVVGETQIQVSLEMVLASQPDVVEIEYSELKIATVSYNRFFIECKLITDDFLSTELSSERYTPTIFRGLFG